MNRRAARGGEVEGLEVTELDPKSKVLVATASHVVFEHHEGIPDLDHIKEQLEASINPSHVHGW